MRCEACGRELKTKTKKTKSEIAGLASVLELIAVMLGGLALAYEPAVSYKPILLPLAIALALAGHFLMFKKVNYMWCKSCKAEIATDA